MKENFENFLSNSEKNSLEIILKHEIDWVIRDWVKVILLLNKNKTIEDVSEFLHIDPLRTRYYIENYKIEGVKGILKSKYDMLLLPEDMCILYSDKTIESQETKAFEKNWPEIKDHLHYLEDIYRLCFKVPYVLNGKKFKDVADSVRAQMMILMRVTDFIRCITFLTIKGYPEQAGTLAASIFELSHTALSFSNHLQAAVNWLQSNSVADKMPELLKIEIGEKRHVKTYKQLVDKNYENAGILEHADKEYKVYKQLCWMKHSLAKMQDVIIEKGSVEFRAGPYTDERSINHAWFSIEHAGRLVEFIVQHILNVSQDCDTILKELEEVGKKRGMLTQKAIERFGTVDPF